MKGKAYNFGSSDHEPNPNNADRIELMKLARLARYCDYTCTFCFKTFPSAQALGGHQNAHKSERMEEKRLYVRDPIAYRRRIFLQSSRYLKFAAHNGVHPKKYFNGGESSSMVAAAAMAAAGHGLGQRSAGHVNHHNLYHPYQKSDNEKPNFPLDLNLFPCNVEGERASMEVFNEAVMANANDVAFNGVVEDGNGIKCEKLDLTLKL